ncbi:hypothetical protein, partial [Corallococcus exercitus]|uniref:hypothetical protein n=1 Tax=Corallococcus exercitus TaxID=2316736 RepID=UPI001ABF9BB8
MNSIPPEPQPGLFHWKTVIQAPNRDVALKPLRMSLRLAVLVLGIALASRCTPAGSARMEWDCKGRLSGEEADLARAVDPQGLGPSPAP